MDDFREMVKELERFGLDVNQATIYATVLSHGQLRIGQITDQTQIPRSSVYESLKGLTALGLVEKIIDHKFVRIKAYPVGSLRHGLNERLLQTQGLLADLSNLEKTTSTLPGSGGESTTTVRYYKGVSGARQLLWNSLNAKNVVYVYSAFGRSKYVGKKFYMDFVRESEERRIKEQVLINPTERAISLIKRDAGSPLARTRTNDLRFVPEEEIAIKGETFIYDNVYGQVTLNAMGITGFEIESATFTPMQRSIFLQLWRCAKPVAALL